MKTSLAAIFVTILGLTSVTAQVEASYINQIWQIQLPGNSNDAYIVPVDPVIIDTNDPYGKDLSVTGSVPGNLPAMMRRTRVDKPFKVYVSIQGLLGGVNDPAASKAVQFLHHVQSYGTGIGVGLDRTQAIQLTDVPTTLNANITQVFTYQVSSVPGGDRTKVRGEERFSVYSLNDTRGATYHVPPSQLAADSVQVWPIAEGTIAGISQNQVVRFAMPTLTVTLRDLYPDSRTYMRAYRGNVSSNGTIGTVVPGSNQIISDSTPQTRTLSISNYDHVFNGDGRWTMELLTVTPLEPGGAPLVERLAYVTFDLDRTLEVNGSFTTIEQ